MGNDGSESEDVRIESLWRKLDPNRTGHLDLQALQEGLRRIDHPLKDANNLITDIHKAVDLDGDGLIQYHEFHQFVRHTEGQLRRLFDNIDRDDNGELTRSELKDAFSSAGVQVSQPKLNEFFNHIDSNRDGVISYDEWRSFLLFIPADTPSLKTVISYYTASVKVNPEGDVQISDEALNNMGYFLAGGIAGIVSRTSTAPLDRLKVYLIAQTNPTSTAVEAAKQGAAVQATRHAAKPLADACKALWAAGGIRSLFAGNGLNVFKVMPESAIKFGSYEASKRMMATVEGHSDPTKLHPWSQFAAGGLGGITSQFFVYPLDTLKFRMQCETVRDGLHGNALIMATARKMWTNNGFRSFYRGLPMGLVGMFPYSAIDLTTFEYLKRYLTKQNARKRQCSETEAHPGAVATAFIGGFSGALGASMVYPLNLLRTRLQTQGTIAHPRKYNGIWDVTVQTVKGEGFRGLFKGVTPNLLKVVPAVSITYVVYESSKKALHLA